MQNEHKPVVTDEGIETVTETDEAVLKEIDRGIYRDRYKTYRSWNTWISNPRRSFGAAREPPSSWLTTRFRKSRISCIVLRQIRGPTSKRPRVSLHVRCR